MLELFLVFLLVLHVKKILYSMINMKLRDSYSSLDDLCYDQDENRAEIEAILDKAGYRYDEKTNQFKGK